MQAKKILANATEQLVQAQMRAVGEELVVKFSEALLLKAGEKLVVELS